MAFSKQTTLKQQLTRISPLSVTMILLFAAVMTYLIFRAFAASGTATLYTSPTGTQSVTNGQSFAVNVRTSTPSNAPTVCGEVFMSYSADKLQVLGESYGGSPYSFEAQAPTNSGGIIHMIRCSAPGTTVPGGDQLYAQVTFKAVATGAASINFTASSVVTSGEDNTNILSQRNGVTYNIAAPATPPPSSGSGSTSSGGGSTGSTSGSGSSGSRPSGSSGSSGSSSSGGSSGGGSSPSSGGSSGSTSGSGSSGSGTGSSTGTSQGGSDTENLSDIQITVLDSDNKPVEGAEVTISGQTVKTDKNGIAHFDNVPTGQQDVAVKYNGKKTAKSVQVAASQSPQVFKVAIVRNKFNPALLFVPIFILVAAGGLILRPWEKFAKVSVPGQTDANQVVISDQQPTPTPITPQTPGSHKLETPGTVYSPESSADRNPPAAKDDTEETK